MFLLVTQDKFTKWVEFKPLRRATAKTVTEALKDLVICRFGSPRILISDNGVQFDSRIFRKLLADMGIQHRFTPPYTPQCNPVERANKVIKTMVAQYCEKDHAKWYNWLPEFRVAIN